MEYNKQMAVQENTSFSPVIAMTRAEQANFAGSQSNGVFVSEKPQIEIYDVPTSTLVVMKGRNAADSANAAVEAFVFNISAFNKTADADFQPVLNDGFGGRNIDRHILLSKNGRGLKVKEITFIGLNAAGNQDATILQALDLEFVGYTVRGGKTIPVPIDISTAIRNTQFQSGTLTIKFPEGIWINGATQMKADIAPGATVTANIEWAR